MSKCEFGHAIPSLQLYPPVYSFCHQFYHGSVSEQTWKYGPSYNDCWLKGGSGIEIGICKKSTFYKFYCLNEFSLVLPK